MSLGSKVARVEFAVLGHTHFTHTNNLGRKQTRSFINLRELHANVFFLIKEHLEILSPNFSTEIYLNINVHNRSVELECKSQRIMFGTVPTFAYIFMLPRECRISGVS